MASRLVDLPAELKLAIFETFTAAEIQQTRLICRDICAFVDVNTSLMVRRIRRRECARLEDEINGAINYKGERLDVVPALRR